MGSGKKAVAARRWLWENIAFPTLKDSSYDKYTFTHFWKAFWDAKQDHKGQFQRLLATKEKEAAKVISVIHWKQPKLETP